MFAVRSRVRQVCSKSASLFIIVFDRVKRKVVEEKLIGIRLKRMKNMDDLNFVDNVCLMSCACINVQEKMERIIRYDRNVELKLSGKETKLMVKIFDGEIDLKLNDETF